MRDQLVAVKVFKVDAPPEQAEQIADALQAVVDALPRHRGLIELIAAGVERDTAYLVMAHCDVPSLDTRLKPGLALDAEEALRIVRTLADAIDAAHARGIVHGGLHPRDIFVDDHGGCRAAGFGVATALARAGVRVPVRRPYSPPERLTSAPIEPTADRFALGAIAFELLSGRRIVGIGADAAARCPTPVPGADATADTAKLQMALAVMLAEQPTHRPSSATAFAKALTLALFPHGLINATPAGHAAAGEGSERTPGGGAGVGRDDRHDPVAGATLTAAGLHQTDGPSPDDLELFTRQGTLWEGPPRDEGAGRWDAIETVDTVAPDEDPLALFASETEPAESPGAAPQAHEAGAGPDQAASPEAASHEPGPTPPRPPAAITPPTPDSTISHGPGAGAAALIAGAAAASRAGDASLGDVAEAKSGSTVSSKRPDSILGLSSFPSGPAADDGDDDTDVDDTDVDESSSDETARRADVADRADVSDAGDEDYDDGEDTAEDVDEDDREDDDAMTDRTSPLRFDHEDLDQSPSIAARGPGEFDDESSLRGDEDDRDEREEDDDTTEELFVVTPAASAAAASAARESYARDAGAARVASPSADRSASASPGGALLGASEPSDVGSSLRVVSLVLAVGLAVGGAGGYLLGQRSALRSAAALDQAVPGSSAPTSDAAPTDAAAPGAATQSLRAPGSAAPGSSSTDSPGPASAASGSPAARGPAGGAGTLSSRTPAGSAPPVAARQPGPVPAAGRATPAAEASRGAASIGRLTITSTPPRAEVAINGVRRGVTPVTLRNLPLGALTVRVTRSGYAPETRRVSLAASKPSDSVAFDLEPAGRRVPGAAPTTTATADTNTTRGGSVSGLGALYIVSRPMGARVTVDGRAVGTTPLMLTDVSSGSHTVQLELTGHKALTTTVQVTPGQRTRVAASLEEGT